MFKVLKDLVGLALWSFIILYWLRDVVQFVIH